MAELELADLADNPIRKSNTTLWVVVALVVLGLAALAVFYALRTLPAEPDRVVILVTGSGTPEDHTAIRESLATRLDTQGFVTHPGKAKDGEPREYRLVPGSTAVDAAREAVRLGAGHVAHVAIKITGERPGIERGGRFISAEATVTLSSPGGKYPSPEPRTIGFATERKTRAEAIEAMREAFTGALFPVLVEGLLASPPMRQMLSGDQSFRGLVNAARFRSSQNARTQRKQKQTELAASCQKADRLLGDLASHQPAITCVTSGCDEEYLSGVTPDGNHALVRVETGTASYTFEHEPKLVRFETPDRLELVPLNGKSKRRTLALGANLYTYPDLSRDGRRAALVEKAAKSYAVVTVDIASGKRSLVHVAPWPARVQWAKLSPDGEKVLFFLRESKRGSGVLMVGPAVGGLRGRGTKPRPLSGIPRGAEWVEVQFEGKSRAAVALLTSEPVTPGPTDEKPAGPGGAREAAESGDVAAEPGPVDVAGIALLDPDSDQVLGELRDPERPISWISGSFQGALYASYRRPGDVECGFVRYAPGEEPTWVKTSECLDRLEISPRGELIGTRGRDLHRVNAKSGQVTQITRLPARGRYPRFARDSGRIAFELLLPREHRGFPRSAICSLEL